MENEKLREEASRLIVFIDDFDKMGTGALIRKYPDVGAHEGFHAVVRKANGVRAALKEASHEC